jgi:hypothetical protein
LLKQDPPQIPPPRSPTPTHPSPQHQRPPKGDTGTRRNGERRRSEESRRSGAGRAPTARPFIIAACVLRRLHLSSTAGRICIELKGQRRLGRADLRHCVLR